MERRCSMDEMNAMLRSGYNLPERPVEIDERHVRC